MPTSCVSEHAGHANVLLQVEEYTGGSAALNLGARHLASRLLNMPNIRRDLKVQYRIFRIINHTFFHRLAWRAIYTPE